VCFYKERAEKNLKNRFIGHELAQGHFSVTGFIINCVKTSRSLSICEFLLVYSTILSELRLI
jgi:hypothetical protein